MYNIVTVTFKDSNTATANGVRQWDYGQILRIQGLQLPTAVEVHFALIDSKDSVTRIGITKDGVTDVVIPDSMIEAGKNIFAYVYLRDSESGQTEYEIKIVVTTRAKPEAFDTPEDKELFAQAIEAVNEAADRAEKAGQAATEAAGQAAEDAQQTAQDRAEVAKMVETVTDISEQVKKVEELSNKAQESATQAGASAVATEKAKAQAETAAGKTAEDRIAVNQAKIAVDEVQEAVRADRAAVEEVKQSVEQLSNAIPESTQAGVQAVNQARQTAVDEIARTGTSHKTAVEGAGTQAVESVENVQQVATEAVETAKTEAVQAVQAEGAKQIKEVQDKGAEVLQSIPEDFTTQMETKLDKQQGIENKGKALVIGEDGNVVPGEVASGGGDGIAIINTMSGESPLVIPDSAERVNKRLELGGKTEQVTTTGKNLFDPNNNYEDLVWIRNDGEIVGGSNARTSDYIPVEQGNYAFQFDIPNPNQMFVAGYNADRAFVKIVGIISKGKCIIKIDDIQIETIRLSYTRESTRIQLERSETQTPYEPYTGGKPSPSPEYPQEIKNVGKWNDKTKKYEVDVKITGKNLLDIEKAEVSGGNLCTAKRENNIVKITAIETVTSKRAYAIVSGGGICLKSGKTYFLNGRKVGTSNMTPMFAFFKEKNNGELLKMGNFYTPNEDICIDIGIYLVGDAIRTGNTLEITDIIVCEGKDAAQYQPYTEQLLTLTSDRPITKWDKLVEQDGQIGWLYNSVNETIDGKTGKWSIQPASKIFYRTDITFPIAVPFCSELLGYDYSSVGHKKDTGITINNLGILCITLPEEVKLTLDAYKQYLADNPLHVLYKDDSEEFVPLPQSEQNAIRALKTCYPTTVITADGGELDPDIKVTYTADTKNYIDGKVSAKVASILRQYQADTANLLSLMPMETQATMIENDTNNILNNLESEEAHE